MNADKTLDVIGQTCPMPLLKTKNILKNMGNGEMLKVLATDPSYHGDIFRFCESGQGKMMKYDSKNGVHTFYIEKRIR